ncbi:uncharacterized protein LOC124368569 [Homalodisca vitripennis]|uniref:uncharacterized protein LOC124368569 n=1 Tax=Homalodisca vitripennis TaxID=197043 RepID=UPI001EEADF79|nr:uncharacterized protein LOC124368569 [Homalodisca vitripennis]
MDDDNYSELWNKAYWILAAVGSYVILWIVCSYYCYRQNVKRAAARQAQFQARLSYLRFGPRIFTVGSETVEMDDVETANEVPRGPDMGGGCCSRVVPDPPASH